MLEGGGARLGNPEWTPEYMPSDEMPRSHIRRDIMNERQWELYRLSVVEKWSDSPYKKAVSAAIEHKLMVLARYTAAVEQATKDVSAVYSRKRHALI